MSKIIFYHPVPLVENPKKGSQIRPLNMLKAFKKNGYHVETIVGEGKKRKKDINKIKSMISDGERFRFMYAESANITIPLADSHHIPVRPLQDYLFFRFLNRQKIPIGLFYRDVYWRVEGLKKFGSLFKYYIKQLSHWFEWFGIKKTVDHLFLPTNSISKYLPTKWPDEKLSSLYPGCRSQEQGLNDNQKSKERSNSNINAFYVGGVKPPYYDLKPMMEIVERSSIVNLKLCCREEEWNSYAGYYKNIDFSRIEIVHADSTEIEKYYNWADIVLDIRHPKGYFKSAMPIKLIEAIGYEVPVILLEGTESADFVNSEKTGWVFEDKNEVVSFLSTLKSNREILAKKRKELRKVKSKHTWEARAREASLVLEEINVEH